jgi:two-component system chemotaxis sensor kinase CheA
VTDFLDKFLDDYFAEAEEHLVAIRQALLALEKSVGQIRPDGPIIEELFRSFHSLKGIAGMVDHRETESLAHELESYLRALRDGDVTLSTPGMDLLIKGARALEDSIAARRANESPRDTAAVSAELQTLVQRDAGAGGAGTAVLPAKGNWLCLFTPSPALIARGINVDAIRARLRAAGEITRATPIVTSQGAVAFEFEVLGDLSAEDVEAWKADALQCTPLAAAPADAEADEEPKARQGALLSSGHYVRVDLSRLDELMRMIGNLVILRAKLGDTLARGERYLPPGHYRDIQDDADAIERELRELREGVMRVRMVPVGEIFRRMPFVVRDLARETGRSVNVVLSGQDTQIDKFLVERMMDPVLHLVRNAISHGVETPGERLSAGKPPAATLRLSASASGETVTLEIADDGRGIDADRVIERARRAGLPVPAGPIDAAALLDLISAPGFSTRDESDRVSGRGYGMNVVRETLQELGGTIQLETTPGAGTRFVIELPLTLAIAAAMIARIGDQIFAVPQASVREVAEFETAGIHQLQGAEVVDFRGTPLPVIRLSRVLNLAAPASDRMHAFIIGTGPAAVGLLVDRIVGHREIVVRSTADPLIRVDAITGATDLGDGKAVLILDAAAIARRARDRQSRGPAAIRDIA